MTTDRSLRMGPTRYSKGGWIKFGRYASGELGMTVYNDKDEPEIKPSISFAKQFGAMPHGEYALWLKAWAENEGVPEALVDAGIVTLTGRRWHVGHNDAHGVEATLTDKAIAMLKTQEAARR